MTHDIKHNEGDVRSPDPEDFSFFGFDGLMRQINRASHRVEIRGGEPAVTINENATYLPKKETGLSRRKLRGREGRRTLEVPEEHLAEVDEEIVYLGWLFTHYGHFLMQSLARIWFLAEASPSVRVVFHHPSPVDWKPKRWATPMLEAFGVPEQRILVLHKPTRLRRLYVPEALFDPRSVAEDHKVRVHESMALPYQEVAQRIVGNTKPSTQPVYLSRRLLPSSQRLMIGEAELEDALRHYGFRIAYPETMAFEDQVRLINAHTDIFSNAGSAAQNVLFALHTPRIHLLTNGAEFSPDYFMHSSLVGVPTTFINCLGTSGRRRFRGEQKINPHVVNVPALVRYLDERGFVAESRPRMPSADDPALLAQYDEAWLFGRIRNARNRREDLPPEIEREALDRATTSWPVTLSLMRYFLRRDIVRAEGLMKQFVTLAAKEHDAARLARYRVEVEDLYHLVTRLCSTGASQLLADAVAGMFSERPTSRARM